MQRRAAVLTAVSAIALMALPAAARSAETTADLGIDMASAYDVQGLEVHGAAQATTTATGLDLTPQETPQSVSIMDREQIRDFALTNANDLLDQVVGINVERVETDRTYFNARGFDITNFQVDGIGLPLIWGIQFGDLDTAIFDRVETVRGANAMMTGAGNPSATINYVRKRPQAAFGGSLSASYGSWDDVRLEADVTGPLNASGTLRGRAVYANENKDSYLDYYGVNRNVYLAALQWHPTDDLTLTGGFTRQDNRARGVLWGALPLVYSDGARIDYPVSASTSADWTHWNTLDQSVYGEALVDVGRGWTLKANAAWRRFEEHAQLLYAFGNPDPVTGLGVAGMTGIYPSRYDQAVIDLSASGPVNLGGRTHQLVAGFNASRSHGKEWEAFSPDFPDYPAVWDWGTLQVAEPAYPDAYLAADQKDTQYRLYAAAHLDLSDRLKAVFGVNWTQLTSRGYSYGIDTPRDESRTSPYVGAMFEITPNVSAYASYTDIFNPQSEVDSTHRTLPAAKGRAYEAGLKTQWLENRLFVTAAIFRAEQDGLATYAGDFPDGKSFYSGLDTRVDGYELEVTGVLAEGWTVSGGWTGLRIEDSSGAPARLFAPRRTLKLATTYSPPAFSRLKVGGALRWQSQVEGMDLVPIVQDAYAVVDLMASLELGRGVRATVNVRNVGDDKHLASVMWNQAYYAAPRSASVTLSYDF